MRKTAATGCVVAVLVLVSACGGDDGGSSSSGSDDYANAIATALSKEEGTPFTADELKCLAKGMIDVMGTDMFVEANLSPSDIATSDTIDLPDPTDEEMTKLVDLFINGDCVDMPRLMADAMQEQSGGNLTDDQANCLGEAMVASDGFGEAFTSGITGTASGDAGASMEADIMDAIASCDIPLDAFG